MSRSSSESLGPLLARSRPSVALRVVLLFWIGLAALAVGWQLGTSDIPTSPPGPRYLVFIVALVAIGGVSTLRSKGPGGILMATVSALALTVIAVIGADTVAPSVT